MAGNETYSLRFVQKFCKKISEIVCTITACIALFLIVGLLQNIPFLNIQSKAPSAASIAIDNVLSVSKYNSDESVYKQIFYAQKSANWELADEGISKLSDDVLLGDILAERYLHRHYDTSQSEIITWLKNYSDHSQAADIIELASRKYPELSASLPKKEQPKRLQGYGDANAGDVRFDDNPQAKKLWAYALEAWRSGKKSESAKFFSALSDKQSGLSDWQYSAASFWAYRANLALGEKITAHKYLAQAARNSRVFYGILARKKLNKPLELDAHEIEVSAEDSAKLRAKPEVKRIITLAQSGLNERAETQIRLLFPAADKQEKWALLSLASSLNLASAQISMAKQLETSGRQLDALKYPVPQWQPSDGFNVDPNIIYALMRQESGFRQSAISSGGALGLMQLMPQTARKMQHSYTITHTTTENISEPVLNITLGERYVNHLLGNNLINGNLFYMLTAYNAGAGRLKEWQDTIAYNDDPLLFVESIPYAETRYYVMQVMTNYWIYSELAGAPSQSVFSLLRGDWPSYSPIATPIAKSARRREHNG